MKSYVRYDFLYRQFISASVFGVFSALFCDFGDQFEVVDATGEDPKQFFIGKITKVNYQLYPHCSQSLKSKEAITLCYDLYGYKHNLSIL